LPPCPFDRATVKAHPETVFDLSCQVRTRSVCLTDELDNLSGQLERAASPWPLVDEACHAAVLERS
jgi:hypothetical protein